MEKKKKIRMIKKIKKYFINLNNSKTRKSTTPNTKNINS